SGVRCTATTVTTTPAVSNQTGTRHHAHPANRPTAATSGSAWTQWSGCSATARTSIASASTGIASRSMSESRPTVRAPPFPAMTRPYCAWASTRLLPRLETDIRRRCEDVVMAGHRLTPPLEPMLAKSTAAVLTGAYAYEPKWDGFRCLVFRDGSDVYLGSRSKKPLGRY